MATNCAVKAAIDELYKSLSMDSIIGEPIETGDKIILPVTKMGIVVSTGLSSGHQDSCAEGGAGGCGGIFPVAVVVISKSIRGPEGIRILPLTRPSVQVELTESLSHIASAVTSRLRSR
ncbi:MAG: GerW family sporulation protein [Methanotrichaceae archaeon]